MAEKNYWNILLLHLFPLLFKVLVQLEVRQQPGPEEGSDQEGASQEDAR